MRVTAHYSVERLGLADLLTMATQDTIVADEAANLTKNDEQKGVIQTSR
jgi:hypothetical protein